MTEKQAGNLLSIAFLIWLNLLFIMLVLGRIANSLDRLP